MPGRNRAKVGIGRRRGDKRFLPALNLRKEWFEKTAKRRERFAIAATQSVLEGILRPQREKLQAAYEYPLELHRR